MTRTAIASLSVALMASASAAWAQTDTNTAPAQTAPAAQAAPTDVSPTASGLATPQPAAPAAPGVAAPEPVAPPPPPPPPTGDALYLIQALEQICDPLIKGAEQKPIMKQFKLRNTRDGLTWKLPTKNTIVITAPTAANPNLCRITINYPIDQWRPLVEATNNWAYTRTPPLQMLYQGYRGLEGNSTTWSWEVNDATVQAGLSFTVDKKPDGSPMTKNWDQARLLYNVTPKQ